MKSRASVLVKIFGSYIIVYASVEEYIERGTVSLQIGLFHQLLPVMEWP